MKENVSPELQAILTEIERRKQLQSLSEVPPVFGPFLRPSRYKGAHGGRGSAKSWTFGKLVLKRCVDVPGTRVVCIREVQISLKQSVKRLLEDLIQTLGLGSKFRVLNTHIETPGGGVIIFVGMQNHTAESIKSLEGFDIAWVEEAQSLSQRSLDLLRPTIRKENSELWFTWNPRYKTDPVDAFLRPQDVNPPPNSIVIEASYQDNPYFPAELRKEMEYDRSRDIEKYNHVWGGKYERQSLARVFRNFSVEEFETPEDSAFLLGGDFGFAEDPDVLVRMFIEGKRLYIDHEAYEIGCEIDNTPLLYDGLVCGCNYRRPDDRCQDPQNHGVARKWQIVADSSRPELISYLVNHGYPRVVSAKKGKGSVEEGIKFLKTYDIIIHPRCVHTADEFLSYSYKTHPLTGHVMPVLQDKKNHVIDSARYAVEPVRTDFDYEEAGMTSSATW